MTITASSIAPRLGHVVAKGANGTEIRKHIGFKNVTTYYVWAAGATVAIATQTMVKARELGGLPEPKMSEKAEKAMVASHALAQKIKAEAIRLNGSHKGASGRK